MTTRNTMIDQRVEALCEEGCRAVSAYIDALLAEQIRPAYADLDATQRALLLHELQSIMAVYNNRCRL